MKLVERINTI